MRQSEISGGYIYDKIKKAKDEHDQLGEALTMLNETLGKDNIAYTVLRKQYDEKQREINGLMTRRYVG